jgi:hypothetical protein
VPLKNVSLSPPGGAPPLEETGTVTVTGAPTACSKCHENSHADQFAARQRLRRLPQQQQMKPSLFDREKTAFSLQGSHRDVPCSACDTLRKQADARCLRGLPRDECSQGAGGTLGGGENPPAAGNFYTATFCAAELF